MKKLRFVLIAISIMVAGLTGCSSDEKAKGSPKQETKKEKTFKDAAKYKKLNDFMEIHTGGKIKIIHENSEVRVHDLDQLKVQIESYEVVELKSMGREFAGVFDEKKDGKLAIVRYKIQNTGDKDLYYRPVFNLQSSNAKYNRGNEQMFLPWAKQIATNINRDNDYVVKARETVVGYEAYPLTEEAFEESTVTLSVPLAMKKKEDISSMYGTEGKFHISLNEKGEKKLKHNAKFYSDKIIADDMGDKRMLKEKKEIGRKAKLDDTELTLNGYQFTKFTPNEEEKPRFKKYKNGIVLLTAEFTVKNKGKRPIRFVNSSLHMNKKTQKVGNEMLLANNLPNELIIKGKSEKILQVYVIDEEQYEKILKNKTFEVEFGPLFYEDKNDLFGNEKAEIRLPN